MTISRHPADEAPRGPRPRNRYVASVLNRAGLGTLLFDLLTTEEEYERGNVFDIALLAGRLVQVTNRLGDQPQAAGLQVGYFGASTGLEIVADLARDWFTDHLRTRVS